MISVNQHWYFSVRRTWEYLLSLRFMREITKTWDGLLDLIPKPQVLCVWWRASPREVCIQLAVIFLSDNLEILFIIFSASCSIWCAFVIFWSGLFVILSLSSVINWFPHDMCSTLNCTLWPSCPGSNLSMLVFLWRLSILCYLIDTCSIQDCFRNCLICDVKYRLIALSWYIATILEFSSLCTTNKCPMSSPMQLLTNLECYIYTLFPGENV